MAQSKLSNLINAQVFADAVSAKLGDAIKLTNIAFVQDLQEKGGTIVVPKYAYIGDAGIVAEGVAINPALLSQTSDNLPVVKMAHGIELTDEAVNGSYGDPMGEAENQIVKAIASGLEKEMFGKLSSIVAGMTYTTPAGGLTGVAVLNSLAKFGEDQEGAKYLYINPADMVKVKTDINFVDGKIFDCELVISNRVTAGTAYIFKEGAVGFYLAKDVNVETDRNILTKSTVITADALFATHLRDASKAVKIVVTP